MLIFAILIGASASSAVLGGWLLLRPSPAAQRVRSLYAQGAQKGWADAVAQLVGPFARLSLPDGEWDRSPLRQRLVNAGIRRADARFIYYGLKTLLPLAFGLPAWFVLRQTGASGINTVLFVLVAALAGCYAPTLGLAYKVRERRRDIFESFPDAADLMLVCVEAGQGLDASMQRIAEEMRHRSLALAEELFLTNLELRAGVPRQQALRHLADRTGIDEVGVFAAMLTQADKFGSSIGDSLRVFSDDLRHKRLVRAEERAATVSTRMLLPLVLLIFPSVIMVILGPAGISIIRSVPALFGQS
jgi:tight adherence protein C